MGSNRAAFESFGGDRAVVFTTASGVEVRGRCLTLGKAIELMRLDEEMREQAALSAEADAERQSATDPKVRREAYQLYKSAAAAMSNTFMRIVDEFQKATGTGDCPVSPAEVLQEVLPHFLAVSGTAMPTLTAPATRSTTVSMS